MVCRWPTTRAVGLNVLGLHTVGLHFLGLHVLGLYIVELHIVGLYVLRLPDVTNLRLLFVVALTSRLADSS